MKKRTGKKKRIGRKQLIERIKLLQNEIKWKETAHKEKVAAINDRLFRAGSDPELKPIANDFAFEFTVRPELYGDYCCSYESGSCDDDEIIEKCKVELAHALAKGMIEQNLVQFIIKGFRGYPQSDNPVCGRTVGIKAYIVPWERMQMHDKNLRFYYHTNRMRK